MLFIGDYYQLPAIEGKESPVFKGNNQYKLTEVVRQAEDSYIIALSTKVRDIIKYKNYQDIVEFIEQNSPSDLEIFYDKEEFIDDFTTPHNWYEDDKILTTFTNDDVDYYNSLIREKYWEAHNISSSAPLIKDDTLVFQSALTKDDKLIYQNNDIVTLASATQRELEIKQQNISLYYYSCVSRDRNVTFNVLDPKSKSLYKELLDKLALKAKREKDANKRKSLWFQFFKFKEFFANVKYSFSSTIHKLL